VKLPPPPPLPRFASQAAKTNYEPFLKIEGLKQYFFHQLERLVERLEDFDL
jgi:hypothetical protein